MKVYVINFTILIIIGLLAERFRKYRAVRTGFFLWTWLQLSLIAALRWQNGLDFNQYYNTFFEVSNASGWAELLQRREEVGFLFFNWCVSQITGNVIVYFFFYHGLMYGLLLWYIHKYSEVKWVSVLAVFAFEYYSMSFCFIRQGMAMAIGLFALEMMRKKKWYWAVLLILAASLFHSSAWILLLCLIGSYIDFSNRKVQIAAVAGALVLYFGCDFFLEHILIGPFAKYRDYLDSQFMAGNHILIVYYPILVFVLAMFFRKKLCEEDHSFSRMYLVLFLGTLFSLMSTKHYIIERMSLYITIYNIRVVAQILALFRDRMKEYYRLAAGSAVIISIGAYIFGLNHDRYGVLPYKMNETYLYQVDLFKDFGFGENTDTQ